MEVIKRSGITEELNFSKLIDFAVECTELSSLELAQALLPQLKDQLHVKPLFNPHADTSYDKRKLIGGETTNLMMLSNNKYSWSYPLYKTMMQNF